MIHKISKFDPSQPMPEKKPDASASAETLTKLQAQKEALEKTQQIAKTAQARQLLQTRTETPTETPSVITSLGNDKAKIDHMQAFEDGLDFLLKNAPQSWDSVLQNLQASFANLQASIPPYPSDFDSQLSSFCKTLNTLAAQLSPDVAKQYVAIESKDYNEAAAAIQSQIDTLKGQEKSNQDFLYQAKQISHWYNSFENEVAQMGKIPAPYVNNLCQDIDHLMSVINNTQTNPLLRSLLVNTINNLSLIKPTSSVEDPKLLAKMYASRLAWVIADSHSLTTPQYVAALKDASAKLDPNNNSSFFKDVKDYLAGVIQKPFDYGILSMKNPKMAIPDPSYLAYLNQILDASNLTPSSVASFQAESQKQKTAFNEATQNAQSNIAGYQKEIQELQTYQAPFAEAAKGNLNQDFPDPNPTPLPSALQTQIKSMVQNIEAFIQMLGNTKNPNLTPLLQLYQTTLKGMHTPPTVGDLHQLNVLMQGINGMTPSLSKAAKEQLFQIESQMYLNLEVAARSDASDISSDMKKAIGKNSDTYSLVQILKNSQTALQAWTTKPLTPTALASFGKNLLQLIQLENSLPTNSPLLPDVKSALANWEKTHAATNVYGYAMWAAAVQSYASSADGTVQNFKDVYQFFNSLDVKDDPTLAAAVKWIQTTFPENWPGYAGKEPPSPSDVEFINGQVVPTFNHLQEQINQHFARPGDFSAIQSAFVTQYQKEAAAMGSSLPSIFSKQTSLDNVTSFINSATRGHRYAYQQSGQMPEGPFLQQALQPMIQTEIQQLQSLLEFLKKYAPSKDQSQIAEYEEQLAKISKASPSISQQSLQQLSDMLNSMNTLANDLPAKSYKATFWNTEANLYKTLGEISDATSDNNGAIYNALHDMYQTFSNWESGKINPGDMGGLTQDIQTLMENGTVLSYGDFEAIESFLTMLGDTGGGPVTKGGPNTNLSQVITIEIQNNLLKQYLSQPHPGGESIQGFKQFIQKYISNLPTTNSVALKQLEQGLLNVNLSIASPTNPDPLFPIAVFDPSKAAFDVNSEGVSGMEQNFVAGGITPPAKDWSFFLNTLQNTFKPFDPTTNGVATLQELSKKFQTAQGVAEAKAAGVDSLADLFRKEILGKYMPGQEALLAKLALALKFNNLGATDANDILDRINSFTQAANNYDFTTLLHGGSKGKYPGGKANAQSVLNEEKNAAKNDQNALNQAISLIKQQITNLNNNHEFDGDPDLVKQKAELISKLTGYLNNMTTAQGQLSDLQKVLDTLKISGDQDSFSVTSSDTNWQTDLSKYEDLVINGNGDANPAGHPPTYKGGLSNIETSVKGDQQDYSNQSQSQQMSLQLTMTDIQQEWSIVSTVMTTLNQAYMTIAQGIYK